MLKYVLNIGHYVELIKKLISKISIIPVKERTKETLQLLLIEQNRVAGYLIGEITRDENWGDRGQVSLGGIAMGPAHWDNFPLLYRELAHHWATKGIVKHSINYFDYDRQGSETLNNMGFARQ